MKSTRKLTMAEKEKDSIINGLNLLIEYGDCYEDIFGSSLTADYAVSFPEEMLEAFKTSLESSYIDIIQD